ncbi:MAG TPA: OB-fold nucleic acid binding domain-containing protein [Candidatus Onthousia faecipullorum]|uniref:OB-fold nucleic acid binding domain-containing protein n=1 Tax=Candidatus Onthousia faecipullorum TaxID=2840887 RepID=A0A9D1KCD3_9FIRM|nr:OB-fold nucleic acid binding domain-containing protein [Candidatus Onthousia faecipullorum]
MNTEEKKSITVEQEKTIKKISTVIMIVIIVIGVLVTTDIILVTKVGVGPFLAINTKTYDDGGTKEYYGLGYKVIKYNQVVGRRDTVIGSWFMKYNTTPKTFTIRDLAYSIINDNNNHVGEFIRLTGTISNKSNKNNIITLTFKDDIEGKYNLTVKAELLSDNIRDLEKEDSISLIGVVTSYSNKTLTIENVFAE